MAVGIAFGELIKNAADYEWVWCEDEYGSGLSVAPVGYDGVSHPVSMIEKRIARREHVNIADLRDDTIWTVQSRIADGRCAPRASGE